MLVPNFNGKVNSGFFAIGSFIAILTLVFAISAQTSPNRSRNNPYSPSPTGKATAPAPVPTSQVKLSEQMAFVVPATRTSARETLSKAAPVTPQLVISVENSIVAAKPAPLTDIYRVGIGDALLINLKNSPQGSGYYTVRGDGTIDFPLANTNVRVVDQTVDKIAEILAALTRLYTNPQFEVKVSEYASHEITVGGLAANNGTKYLRREAMPLFAVMAEAEPGRDAALIQVTRSSSLPETYVINEPNTGNVLVYPGDRVEFLAKQPVNSVSGYFFLAGFVASGGKRDLIDGTRLYQAVTVAGGTKGNAKKAAIRRTDAKGTVTITEYDLPAIRERKIADPLLRSGDIIEIKK